MNYVEKAKSLSTSEIISLLKSEEELHAQCKEVSTENADLRQEVSKLKPENEYLKKQVSFFKKQLFGAKSEKRFCIDFNSKQLYLGELLFGEPKEKEEPKPETEDISYSRTKRKKGKLSGNVNESGGLQFSEDVPVVTVKLPNPELEGLSEEDYEVIKTTKSYTLAQQPIVYTVIEYVQDTVKIKESKKISINPKFPSPLEGSYADVSLLANILVDKFCYHLPLYRQHQRIKSSGIRINRANLTNYVHKSLDLLSPIYKAQLASIKEGEVIWMDETPMKAGVSKNKRQMKSGYLWSVYGSRDEVAFHYSPSRGQKVIQEILDDDFSGVLQTDDHSAYSSYVSKMDDIEHALCWSHLRRKILKAEESEPELVEKALCFIRKLYSIEEKGKKLEAEKLLKLRGDKSKLIVDAFFEWLRVSFSENVLLPSNAFTEGANYALSNEEALRVFLANPSVSLDTNHLECAR